MLGSVDPAPNHAERLCALEQSHVARRARFVDPPDVVENVTPFDPLGPMPSPGFTPAALRVRVFLPNGYDGRRRFPVLYLLHGGGDDHTSWSSPGEGDLLHVAGDLSAVVVMPEAGRGLYVNWWNDGTLGSPAWERYFFEELIPLIERRLQIRPARRYHAVAGLSMGALGAIIWGSQRPGYFGTVGAFSGPLHVTPDEAALLAPLFALDIAAIGGDPVRQAFYWHGHDPVRLAPNLRWTRLYVTVGDGTPRPGDRASPWTVPAEALARQNTETFIGAARRAGARPSFVLRQGVHDWASWRYDLAATIRWGLFHNVVERPARWTYATVAQHSRAWGIRFDFTRTPRKLIRFRRQGHRLTGTGAGTVTITTATQRRRVALPFTLHLSR